VAVGRGGYYYGGRTYYRPGWGANRINAYRGGFVGYPGWRTYGTFYGLYGPLVGLSSLAFLSAGLLIGSYTQQEQTVYVYVVDEDGVRKEYRVDGAGNILSVRTLPD
jgi:hypothetical protein